MGVMTRIEDLNTVLGQTQDHRHRVLVAAAKNLKNWFVKVRKIKAIYHTLNLFNLDVTQKCLIAECWVPVLDIETIQMALRRGTVSRFALTHEAFPQLSESFLGTVWIVSSADSKPDGDIRRPSDLQSDEQVHARFPSVD